MELFIKLDQSLSSFNGYHDLYLYFGHQNTPLKMADEISKKNLIELRINNSHVYEACNGNSTLGHGIRYKRDVVKYLRIWIYTVMPFGFMS